MAIKQPKPEAVKRKLDKADRVIDDATIETMEALQKAVENYAFRLETMLRRAFDDPDELPKLGDALALGDQLADALLDSGMDKTLSLFTKRFLTVERQAAEYFTAFGVPNTMAGIDRTSLKSLVKTQEQAFADLADRKLVAPLRDALANSVVGGRTQAQALESVMAAAEQVGAVTKAGVPFTDFQLETLVSDSFRRHYRQTKAMKAHELGLKIVWFQGPDDSVTSPQCRAMLTKGKHGVPNMYLVEEFTMSLHPALKRDPLTGGGHPGCRHTVSYVTPEFAESKGFRIPKGADVPRAEEVEENAKEL